MQRLITLAAVLLLAACASLSRDATTRASIDDAWALSPRDLPAPLALQQQLVIERGAQSQAFDALLQVDADGLQLAVQALGQTAMTLRWDGARIDEKRADWLPPQVDGARVLADLQFALWPLAALQRGAPQGWRVAEQGGERLVLDGERVVARVRQQGDSNFDLERPTEGYRLRVRSIALEDASR